MANSSKLPTKLELHYFFDDESHTMNAHVRHACEGELLAIARDLIQSLGLEITIESEPYHEGGLREFWRFVGKHPNQSSLIVAILALFLSRIPVENKEIVALQIQNLKLDNELKEAELKKIKEQYIDQDQITDEVVRMVLDSINRDYRYVWHKSNFYRKLTFYPRVTSLSTQTLDEENKPTQDPINIPRDRFGTFVLHWDKLPPQVDENALITIVSPVLVKGDFAWKGIYQGEVFGFEMKDAQFKQSVLGKQIEFTSGTAIRCVLVQHRKIDEAGIVRTYRNEVKTVLDVVASDVVVETAQGKKHRADLKLKSMQIDMDFSASAPDSSK